MLDESLSSRAVDICATILSDSPPQLPLRQEYMSLGFEVVFNADGVGQKATENEAKKAVESYRTMEAIKEFRKRRFVPKKYKRIKEKLEERKRIERDLALPLGVSYESYQAELNRLDVGSLTSASVRSGFSSSELSENDLKRRRNSWLRRRNLKKQSKSTVGYGDSFKGREKKQQTSGKPPIFPDFLAPIDNLTDRSCKTNNFFESYTKDAWTVATKESSFSTKDPVSPSSMSALSAQSPLTTKQNVEIISSEETKPFLPGLMTVRESSDDDSRLLSKNTSQAYSNPFTVATSSDRSDAFGLNPLDAGARFPDSISNNSPYFSSTQQPSSNKQQSVVPITAQISAPYFVNVTECEKDYITEQTNWMGESKKCFDNLARELCNLVEVEAKPVDGGKSKTGDVNKTDNSCAFSVFSDLSPDVYNAAGLQVANPWKQPATATTEEALCSGAPVDGDSDLKGDHWISVTRNACGSAALDIFHAVVLDNHENEIIHHNKHEESTVVPSSIYGNQDFFRAPTLEMKAIENERKPDPPMDDDSSAIDPTCIQIVSSHTSLDEIIADFNRRTKKNVENLATKQKENNTYLSATSGDPTDATSCDIIQSALSNEFLNPLNEDSQIDKSASTGDRTSSTRNSLLDSNMIPTASSLGERESSFKAKADSLKASLNALKELRRSQKMDPPQLVIDTKLPSPTNNDRPLDNKDSRPENLHIPLMEVSPPQYHEMTKYHSPLHSPKKSENIAQERKPGFLDTVDGTSPESPTNAWMQSAKSAIQSLTSEVYKVAGIENNGKRGDAAPIANQNPSETQEDKLLEVLSRDSISTPWGRLPAEKLTKTDDDIGTLFNALTSKYPPMLEVERILTVSPELVQVRQQHDGRMPLHALCDRGMPDRSTVNIEALTDNLLRDIASYKRLVNIVVTLFPEACLVQDNQGDLPAHLIARGLMQWEAEWYEKVYLQASKEKGTTGKTALAITKLYHNMSEAAEMLLRPLANDAALCKAHGSMGTILPLHIACIFTSSVNTIRLMLEAYPEAAKRPCDLGILQTFIPDESLPLELHDNLSTDFPKWEIEAKQSSHPEVRWSQSELEQSQEEDCMRRSDLLFAYNPIEPHRFEKARMRRLEARIQFEAKRAVYDGNYRKLNRATELLWIWMCTFKEPDSQSPTYVNSVKRIVTALPMPALRYLVSIQTYENKNLLEQANSECARVIQKRLDSFARNGTSQDHGDTALADDMTEVSSVHSSSFDKTEHSILVAPEFRLQGSKGFVSNLCRLIFNLEEKTFPTSFVILPYKLAIKDGKLRMASQDSLVVAAKFAECLLNLTDPGSILYFLDEKAEAFYDQPIFDKSNDEWLLNETAGRVKEYEESLFTLFESGEAFLYLLDEVTGLPAVLVGESAYPISLREPQLTIRKLLPLMMMGMVQMRGEKALSKLANVILDKKVSSLIPSWAVAARTLILLLEEKQSSEFTLTADLIDLKQALLKFQSRSTRMKLRHSKDKDVSEWDSELLYLQELLQRHDPGREYLKVKNKDVGTGLVPVDEQTSPARIRGSKEEESVAALAKKLEELSEIHTNVNRIQPHNSEGDSSERIPHSDDKDDQILRKQMISRYSVLFDEFALDKASVEKKPITVESEDYSVRGIKVWNAAKNVWEDVNYELEKSELISDDPEITKLKVALAEQARKLAFLGKKVSALQDEEQRVFNNVSEEDISNIIEEASIAASKNDIAEARRLVLRMCDLEERLLHDEIAIQHFTIETNMMEEEKEQMKDYYDRRQIETQPQKLRPSIASSFTDDDKDARSQAWTENSYSSNIVRDVTHDLTHETWTQKNVAVVQSHHVPQMFTYLDGKPTEIVDLAGESDESDAPITSIAFEDRRVQAPIQIHITDSLGYDEPYVTQQRNINSWSSWKLSSSPRVDVDEIGSKFARVSPSPIHTYDLVDTEFISTKFTLQRRTFSFASSKSSTEILDVTDMSDVSSYYVASPRRTLLPPSSGERPLEIVDVTELSMSQPYSTRSLTRSGYAMTVTNSEIIDQHDIDVESFKAPVRRTALESHDDYYDRRDPVNIVSVLDIRDEISPRIMKTVRDNGLNSQFRTPSFSSDEYRFRTAPSASSDEVTPSSTVAIGNHRRRMEPTNTKNVGLSRTSGLARNRAQSQISSGYTSYRSPSYRESQNRRNNVARLGRTGLSIQSDDDSSRLSPRVSAIDRVISKYTTNPADKQYHSFARYRNGTRKSTYSRQNPF